MSGYAAYRVPRPDVTVSVLVPLTRGDLVARVHAEGELLAEEYTPEGTVLVARVELDLAAALDGFRTVVGVSG